MDDQYTPISIKKYKGKIIMLTYQTFNLKISNTQTGVITASTRNNILFLVNNDKSADELTIPYRKIENIEVPNKQNINNK